MPAAVFAREYLNRFDSLETRFFDPGSIASRSDWMMCACGE